MSCIGFLKALVGLFLPQDPPIPVYQQQYPAPSQYPQHQQYLPPQYPQHQQPQHTPLTEALEKLWDIDNNRMSLGKDFDLDLQSSTFVSATDDRASKPLFKRCDERAMKARPTFNAFIALLGYYHSRTGTAESFTQAEVKAQHDFIDLIFETAPIQYLFKFLIAQSKVGVDLPSFKRLLFDLWFGLYKREVANDSSGFEHTFVGEVRDGQATGLHNWLQFYIEERRGNINYHGYLRPRTRSASPHSAILSLQFSWFNHLKPVSTIILGSSPEFEIAIFTLCYLMDARETHAVFDGIDCVVKTFFLHTRDGKKLASCFIES